jgi:vacuolar-type H+-ATPase subunit D/Vma8
MKDIDESIDRIKGIVTTLVELIEEQEKIREQEIKELNKRTTALEYAVYSRK